VDHVSVTKVYGSLFHQRKTVERFFATAIDDEVSGAENATEKEIAEAQFAPTRFLSP